MLDFGFYNDDCLNILPKIESEREFIGIEIDTKYYDIAAERLKRETAQMNIFDFMGDEK